MVSKQDMDSSKEAFQKFMRHMMGDLPGPVPDFAKTSKGNAFAFDVKFWNIEKDGYAVKVTSEKVAQEGSGYAEEREGWDGITADCVHCDGCDCGEGDVDDFSETTTVISFTITGPTEFAEEIGQDVYQLLRDLRGDALRYARESFKEDADELVSVNLNFNSNIS